MNRERARNTASMVVLATVVLGLLVSLMLLSDDSDQQDGREDAERTEDDAEAERLKRRSATGLSTALETVGGIDGLVLGTAEGAFDLVRFDPNDSNRLLAVQRRSYGVAENQQSNEIWTIDNGILSQDLWAPDVAHDFAHFNADGTITRWIHGGGAVGFAPRIAQVLDRDLEQVRESGPMYASRFVVDGSRVFALLGDGSYASDAPYRSLVVDDGADQVSLTSAADLEWIDSPAPGLVVAYPTADTGTTRVWNSETLDEVVSHALSNRNFQRAAISQDSSTAAGVSFDGALSIIDLRTGLVTHSFGSFDVEGIDQPITLNADGSVAVIVEHDGTVSLWWVADGTKMFSIIGASAQPRWVSEVHAPQSATAVAWDATRLAVRNVARADTPTTWTIIDVDIDSWLEQAQEIGSQ